MNRRGFLSALLAGAATAAIDPEKLLWVPRKKLISIPKRAFMALPFYDLTSEEYQRQLDMALKLVNEMPQQLRFHREVFVTEQISEGELRRIYPPGSGIPDQVFRPSPVVPVRFSLNVDWSKDAKVFIES